jgi:N-acylneuraminate cytidylyltransferase
LREALCIIPARGGSKRVPGKNIRLIGGLPMIAHPIGAALASGLFSRIVVSTDDAEIAGIARKHGAETPFVRDAALANDTAGTAEVVLDAIGRLGAQSIPFVCCLYPTAPLILPEDLQRSFDLLAKSGADGVVPVVAFDFPPQRAFRFAEGDRIAFASPQHALTRSQDLAELVHDAGAFYWLRTKAFLASRRIVSENTVGFRLPRHRAIDIDTEEDFRLADAMFAASRGSAGR